MWLVAVASALLALAPVVASGQSDGSDEVATLDDAAVVSPMLSCNLVGLRILTDDLNGVRLVCRITGASASDTSFNVSLSQPASGIPPRPLCAEGLSGGVGVCRAPLVDPASSFSVTATLQPSGATLGPVSIGPAPAPPVEAPMQFYPLGD